jgi:hypothetical protein
VSATNPLLTAALEYATRGLPVFPCRPRSKEPATDHGFKDATTDGGILQRRLLAAGADCNLAVATGGWGFVLEDDGPGARDWLRAMEQTHGPLPNTWAVSTSPGRGHRYFRSAVPIPSVPKDRLAPDVEIKGEGGYVVCPPSIHPDGHAYRFVIGPEQLDRPAEAPAWLVELILAHQAARSNGQGPAAAVGAVIADGQRNQTLTSLAGTMRRRGMSEAAIIAALLEENAARCSPPLDEAEVRLIAHSVMRYLPQSDGEIRHRATGQAALEPDVAEWHTARDVALMTPATVDWLWQGYLAFGTVNEFDAKSKAGKTTFLGQLLFAIELGQPFLGRATTKADTVYLTEEGWKTLRGVIARSGLTESGHVHYLSLRAAHNREWVELVAMARAQILETGARFLVVDTLTKWAGLKGEDENKSGVAAAIMLPLQLLATELDVCVVVVRHERGEGGELGESGRGSTQFAGDADVILRLQRTGGKTPNRRNLHAVGRFDDTPDELVIELDPESGEYAVIGAEDIEKGASRAIFEWLTDEPVPMSDVYADLATQGFAHATVFRAVKTLVRLGRVHEADERNPDTGRKRKVICLRSVHGTGGLE